MAADVVNYSGLMSADEAGTLAELRRLRAEILAPSVTAHNGNLVKSMGDGWLVSFVSVAEAAACAFQVQDKLTSKQKTLKEYLEKQPSKKKTLEVMMHHVSFVMELQNMGFSLVEI